MAEQARLPSTQAAIYVEIEKLLAVLRHRSNRDKLDDHKFLMAGSMLERWKWNSQLIRDEELREFLAKAQQLVSEIHAVDSETKQRDAMKSKRSRSE